MLFTRNSASLGRVRRPSAARSWVGLFLLVTAWTEPVSAGQPHPLDPLSAAEIAAAVSVIAASGKINRATRAAMITLKEPDKRRVTRWAEGDPADRRAFAILRVDGETIEAVVDLAAWFRC